MSAENGAGVIIFRPGLIGTQDIVISTREELVSSGVHVHPNVIEQTWGKGVDGYKIEERELGGVMGFVALESQK